MLAHAQICWQEFGIYEEHANETTRQSIGRFEGKDWTEELQNK